MYRSRCLAVLLIGAWVSVPGLLRAGAIVTVDLRPPAVTSTSAAFEVLLGFTGDPGDLIEAIQLSVLGSDPQLTQNGSDFSRFTFALNTTALPEWTAFPPGLSGGGVALYGPIDPILGPFLVPNPTPYDIGTLSVDLIGLAVGTSLRVTLAGGPPGQDTDVGGTVGGTFVPSFAGDTSGSASLGFLNPGGVDFVVGQQVEVPEPAAVSLLVLGFAVLFGCRRRRRRRRA